MVRRADNLNWRKKEKWRLRNSVKKRKRENGN